ncbi:MAG TPA: hypothetical protein VKY44_00630 [Flavobacterium sp.]|nr:hypothetical protein [Flavobacterium sp.]
MKRINSFVGAYRKEVPTVEEDRILHCDIQNSIRFLKNYLVNRE